MAERAGLIRVGGRTERTREAVLAAARRILEAGDTNLSTPRLSELSGIHKTTIYRRWPTRELLLKELLEDRSASLSVKPSDDWERYLHDVARELTQFLEAPGELALLRTLAQADFHLAPQIAAIWEALVHSIAKPIAAAQSRGEVAAHVKPNEVIRALIGYIISETLFSRAAPAAPMLDTVVRYLVDGIRIKA